MNGQSTSFGHDAAGRLLSTEADGRSTSYSYDGLDRRASVTDETRFGSDTTGTVWDGFDPVATDSGLHGVTDLVRDPTGGVVFQDGAYEDEWVLGDMRNATATADAGGQITDLVDYADFGGADYESTGWGSLVGNDGQPGDATLGLDHYYARDYDTTTGSWVQPDEWRGLLVRPQSLNRFAYVENSPVAFSDHLGFAAKRVKDGVKGGIAAGIKKAVVKAHLNRAAVLNVNNGANAPRSIAQSDLGPTPNSRVQNPGSRSIGLTAQRHRLGLFTGCAGDPVCIRGHVDVDARQRLRLIEQGYAPFGEGNREIFLPTNTVSVWGFTGKDALVRKIQLEWKGSQYGWVMSVTMGNSLAQYPATQPMAEDWKYIVQVVGSSANMETYRNQWDCHVAGALPESWWGNGSWDFESARGPLGSWPVDAPGRVLRDGAAAACGW